MGWVIRGLLLAGGLIASWFMSREAFQFPIVQFFCGLGLFVLFVALLAFWTPICGFVKNLFGKREKP